MKYRVLGVGPFSVGRHFQRVKARFPSDPDALWEAGPGRDEMERQIALAMLEQDLGDEAVFHAVAIAGLLTVESFGRDVAIRWEPFPAPVWDLAHRLLRVFHPDYDTSLLALSAYFWPTPADRARHLQVHGAAIRAIFEAIRRDRRRGMSYRERLLGRIAVPTAPAGPGFYLNAVISAQDPMAWFDASPDSAAVPAPSRSGRGPRTLWRRFGRWMRPRRADPSPRPEATTRVG